MNRVEAHFHNDQLWTRQVGIAVRGRAFEGATLLAGPTLAGRFQGASVDEDFLRILRGLNGNFAVIDATGTTIRLAVDHIRSIPIYFGFSHGCIYISDDCHWVENRVGPGERNNITDTEFFHSGYVMND
ncbi:MAG: hypothetical protein ACYC6N_28100, partial [Pirellulaceae bacterium]